MKPKWPIGRLRSPAVLLCLAGLAASVIPFTTYRDQFWGVTAFVDREPFSQSDSPGVIVKEIAAGSPAESAGLQRDDRVVSVNGVRVGMNNLRELLAKVRPAEAVTLDVNRDGQDLRLEHKGHTPTLEGVVVLDWQFVSSPVFLVLLVSLIATGTLESPALWRGIVVGLGGVVVVTAALVVEFTQWLPWTILWQSQTISHGPPPPLHYALLIAVLLTGLGLALWGGRCARVALMHRGAKPFTTLPHPPS